MDKTKWNEIQAILLFAVALLVFISFVTFDFSDLQLFTSKVNHPVRNFAGLFGAYLGAIMFFIMGMSAYCLPALILIWAIARFSGITPQKLYFKIFGTFFLILASSAMFSMIGQGDNSFRFSLGGIVGLVFSDFLIRYLGSMGAIIVIIVLFLLSVLLATEFLLIPFLTTLAQRSREFVLAMKGKGIVTRKSEPAAPVLLKRPAPAVMPLKEKMPPRAMPGVNVPANVILRGPQTSTVRPAQVLANVKKEDPSAEERKVTLVARRDFTLPGLDLLDSPPPLEQRKIDDDFEANTKILEETLADFDIEAKVVAFNKGPVITRYELEPAPGVKIHRITSLTDNIALAMKAQSVRIVAPIPGKGTIGVEVPNSSSAIVYLKEVLDSKEYKSSKSKLKLALGKDIAGAPVIADLATMPHLLIAGATGSGKTVCINSLIMSMLFNSTPEDVKFIMIDPKRVELAVFNDMPHLLAPVVTDHKKVASTLDWVVNEMDSRYELLAKSGVRNIDLYNEKFGDKENAEDGSVSKRLPYIVLIIDELADLMMIAQAEVESAITRLAQLSRAVGIHIMLATQRPSVDVITGVIKANFPARISFKVASKVDSRTVLDINGADKLLGRGDMLFIEPGASRPVRAQCSLISDKEIEKITDFIKSQRAPEYIEEILEVHKKTSFKKFDKDELYEEAVKTVLETGQASVSMLQRRLGLGYARAARIIDTMEAEGIVGQFQGSKPRDILVSLQDYRGKSGE
ncbi:MAG: DNA translocase FtsK 4TM domain-containing protein [Candidatus Omnitrophota bacterium]|nr:DNA translocase FtsK 4TM domain-containing protein [Candidatus Omnitrophota bacterium]